MKRTFLIEELVNLITNENNIFHEDKKKKNLLLRWISSTKRMMCVRKKEKEWERKNEKWVTRWIKKMGGGEML